MKQRQTCSGCRDDLPLGFAFEMAFQPIVDVASQRIWGHEALVRGPNGESAASILANVTEDNRYRFDQACRVKAIEAAGRLFDDEDLRLSINFMPNAVYEPAACIRTSLEAARRVGFPAEAHHVRIHRGRTRPRRRTYRTHHLRISAARLHHRARRFRRRLCRPQASRRLSARPAQDRYGAVARHRRQPGASRPSWRE